MDMQLIVHKNSRNMLVFLSKIVGENFVGRQT
jgi:hypothetical protein